MKTTIIMGLLILCSVFVLALEDTHYRSYAADGNEQLIRELVRNSSGYITDATCNITIWGNGAKTVDEADMNYSATYIAYTYDYTFPSPGYWHQEVKCVKGSDTFVKQRIIVVRPEDRVGDSIAITQIDTDTNNILDDTNDMIISIEEINVTTQAILVDTGTTIPAQINSNVTTILSDTNAILVDTSTTIPATIEEVNVTTQAILVDTSTTIPATITTLTTNVEEINVTTQAVLVDTNDLETFFASTGDGYKWLKATWLDIVTVLDNWADYGQRQNYAWFTNGTNENEFKANITTLATQTNVTTILSDTNAILVDTGTTLPGQINSNTSTIITAIDNINLTPITDAISEVNVTTQAILVDTSTTLPDLIYGNFSALSSQLNNNVSTILVDTQAILQISDGILNDVGVIDQEVGWVSEDVDRVLEDTGTTLPAKMTSDRNVITAQLNSNTTTILNAIGAINTTASKEELCDQAAGTWKLPIGGGPYAGGSWYNTGADICDVFKSIDNIG